MNHTFKKLIFIFVLLTYLENSCTVRGLLFPQYTVMQIVAAVSWPIVDPDRKAFVNIGFQFNYGLPFTPASFYDPMYWGKRALSDDAPKNGTDEAKNITKRNVDTFDMTKYPSELNNHMDISAGELYKSLETMLVEAGFHKTCLLKSVCEVSRHPFHLDDEHEDLLAEILQFVLTPSMHQGFGANELHRKKKYEAAENIGRIGGDCEDYYTDCTTSLIDNLSYLSQSL
ncbi:hypothetical protein Bhyg_14480 [Pseudolycoriella hygida]|uniref:Uncharacterized protein n=1 Tax=Pseudolycoriella hygida TaxID=35572 RepID=A0A9Q0MRX9_9DIPT|nr:hypothetical protein Bhyg_14480 [Pseudolycoriella hygida]